ncbi:MAG: serine/threonine-protein kinase [Myxococcota bacterium]
MRSNDTQVIGLEIVRSRTAIHLGLMSFIGFLALIYYFIDQTFSGMTANDEAGAAIGLTAVAFGGGALAVRAATSTVKAVNGIAVVSMFLGCAGYAWMSHLIPRDLRPELLMTLIFAVLLISRSAIVPERPHTTLILGAAMLLPLLWLGYTIYVDYVPPEGYEPLNSFSVSVFLTFLWLICVLTAWAVSRVIYGLRQEVNEAKQLGQYTIEERLGGGGMGHVYRATHGLLQRPTALKLIRFDDSQEREALIQRFEHEVKLTAQLTHPNTITVFDYGQTDEGVFYYAMELLEGASLQQVVEVSGPMEPARAIHVARQAAAALTEAHALNLIHRDIKPANVMLAKLGGMHDVVKVLDFGLVKRVAGPTDAGTTIAGGMVGTPHYMAPESAAGDEVDAQSDVYALGAVLYFLLTARTVFGGNTPVEVLGHHLHSPAAAPSDHSPFPFPGGLDALVMRCLAKNPIDRPAGAAGVLRELDALTLADPWSERAAQEWWDEFDAALTAAAQEQATDRAMPTVLEKRAG